MSCTSPTIIIGGGIHGASVAYFLSVMYQQKCIVIEQTGIAAAASGKAGGFLAKNWGSGPTTDLHRISHDLHKQLAETLDIKSYRQVNTLSVDGNKKGTSKASWLNRKVNSKLMDTDTAQVTPYELTTRLMEESIKHGSEVWIDSAEGVVVVDGAIKGVNLKGRGVFETDKVVICAGPWSGVIVEDWFDLYLPMEGVKSTSLLYKDVDVIRKEPYACFCAEDDFGCHLELYPRPNGDIYICGCGGSDYVTGDRLRASAGGDCASADLIHADPKRVEAASNAFKSMSGLADMAPTVVQVHSINFDLKPRALTDPGKACMRPCTPDGLPVMGKIPGVSGAYISSGHNCWGILWAPVSGLCMAELIAEGKSKTVGLDPFDPKRYMNRKMSEINKPSGRGKKKDGAVPVGEQW